MTENRLPNDRSAWDWIFGGTVDQETPVGEEAPLPAEPEVTTGEMGTGANADTEDEGGPEDRMAVRPLEGSPGRRAPEKVRSQTGERHLRDPAQEWRRAVVLSEILGPPRARGRWRRL
ncbi:MAG: hypothetical protein IRY98_05735 [Alicyclobacillaceae bacterium]|nr:hypothetical protein [Alicyclobacillaceae bacterium]